VGTQSKQAGGFSVARESDADCNKAGTVAIGRIILRRSNREQIGAQEFDSTEYASQLRNRSHAFCQPTADLIPDSPPQAGDCD